MTAHPAATLDKLKLWAYHRLFALRKDASIVTNRSSYLISLLFLLFAAGCSTTQVQESWHLPGYQAPQSQKVLVVAMASKESIRKVIETSFVARLEEKGLTAIPSFQWLPDGSKLNREAIVPLVRQNGITTVLVTSIKDVQKSTAYQPEQQTGVGDNLFRNFDTYYAYSSSGQHETGSYAALTDYLIETNLFDTQTQKLSWSITTRTSETGPVKKAVDEIVKAVVSKAGKDNVL